MAVRWTIGFAAAVIACGGARQQEPAAPAPVTDGGVSAACRAGTLAAPAWVYTAPGIRSVQVNWSAPSAAGCLVTGYRVHLFPSDGPGRSSDFQAGNPFAHVTIEGFNNGTTVCVAVAALSGEVEGPPTVPEPPCSRLPTTAPPPVEVVLHVTPDGMAHVFWPKFSQVQLTSDPAGFWGTGFSYQVTLGSASFSVNQAETHVDVPVTTGSQPLHAEVRTVSAVGVGPPRSSNEWDPGSPWHFARALPDPQAYASSVVLGDRIFLLGGSNPETAWPQWSSMRVRGDGSLDAPVALSSRHGGAAAVAAVERRPGTATVFFAGGIDNPFGLTAAGLFADGSAGMPIGVGKPMAADRYDARSAIIGGHLYVLGGISSPQWGSGHSPTASVLSCAVALEPAPDCGEWVEQSPLPHPAVGFSLTAMGSRLYVIGGSEGGSSEARTEVLLANAGPDGRLSPWKPVSAPLPSGLVGAKAVTSNGKLFVIGGGAGADGQQPTNQILVGRTDPSGDIAAWMPIAERARLIGSRLDPAVALVGDTLYVIGGRIETGLADVQQTRVDALDAAP